MTIGLPQALLYYRCRCLWETFFTRLGCTVVASGDTDRSIYEAGGRDAIDECCLPAKVFLGHVKRLMGRCDYILVPRHDNYGRDDELCARFLGLYDIVRNTYPDARLIHYNVRQSGMKTEHAALVRLGCRLGFSLPAAERAYLAAARRQREEETRLRGEQEGLWQRPECKILIAAQPYLAHDRYLGGQVTQLITEQGGLPLYADRCDKKRCRACSKDIAPRLFWALNKESAGAGALHGGQADGVILLTAFPCGCSSLTNEMLFRQRGGTPVIQILLDELQGQAGLQTRIESFMDILHERRAAYAH